MGEITYQEAKLSDYSDVNKFYNEQYSSGRSVAYWSLAYDKNPMGVGKLFLAISEAQIIGIQGVIPYKFGKNGKTTTAYKSEDSLVDINYRGRKIFSNLYRMVHNATGPNLIWGFTDKVSVFGRVGMPSKENIDVYYTVIDKYYKSLSISKRSAMFGYVWTKQLFAKKLYLSNSKLEIKQWTEEHAIFAKKCFTEKFNLNLDAQLLKWRDTITVSGNTVVIESRGTNGQINDIAVVKVSGEESHILQWYYTDVDDILERAGFITSLKDKLENLKVSSLSFWQSSSISKRRKLLLKSCGFRYKRSGLNIVSNSNNVKLNVNDIAISSLLSMT